VRLIGRTQKLDTNVRRRRTDTAWDRSTKRWSQRGGMETRLEKLERRRRRHQRPPRWCRRRSFANL